MEHTCGPRLKFPTAFRVRSTYQKTEGTFGTLCFLFMDYEKIILLGLR